MARNALLNSGEFAVAAVPLVMAIGSLRVGISRVHSADRITDLPQAFSSSDLESYIGRVLQDPTVKVRLQFRTPAVDAGLADPEESESRGDDPLLDTLGPLREGRLRVGFRDENERLNAVVEYDGGVDGETAQACFRMVALLITSHRLRRMAQAAFGEVSASRRRLMEAQDLAYNQLARDIHDGAKKHFATSVSLVRDLLRSFTTSGSAVSREALEGLLRLLLQGSKSLDNLSRGVYPDSIEWTGGLVGVLEDIAADAEFRVFVDGEPCADETAFDAIPHAVKVALWRVASEALTNAEKYAPDARKSVYLRRVGELVVLEVKDDGPGGAAPVHGHNGLANMLDRVKTLDGKLRIHSPHHEGTAIIAELPAR
jgi:signal transduction histidine kinase